MSRRSKQKYPNLNPKYNLPSRREEIEDIQSYAHKLSDKDKEWLDKFAKEYINASLDTVDLSKNLHNTKELKKSCQDRNNSRNRDLFTEMKTSKKLLPLEPTYANENDEDESN